MTWLAVSVPPLSASERSMPPFYSDDAPPTMQGRQGTSTLHMDKQSIQRCVRRYRCLNVEQNYHFTLVGQHQVEHLGLLAGKLAAGRKQQQLLLG